MATTVHASLKTRRQNNGAAVLVRLTYLTSRDHQVNDNTTTVFFIENVSFWHNGNLAMTRELSEGVARDPILGILIKQAKIGDKIRVAWTDNQGKRNATETIVSE